MGGQAQHQPLFENPKQGKLRTKVENGECLRSGAVEWLQSSPLELQGLLIPPYSAVVQFEALGNQRRWVKGVGALERPFFPAPRAGLSHR